MDSGLLAQIQKGKSLKKAQTNDRSAPQIGGGASKPSGPSPGMARPPPRMPSSQNTASSTASAPSVPSAPQLGGLFSQGMPTLRKTKGTAVSTGRDVSSNAPAPPPPVRPPPIANKPAIGSTTLPRSFKVPPRIPGRGPPPIPNSSVPAPPPPPPPSATVVNNSSIPPAPPPPPPVGNNSSIPAAPPPPPAGIPSHLVPQVPGRARSNSSPQRPIPPPPPRNVPSPPASPAQTRAPSRPVPPAFPNRSIPQPPPPPPTTKTTVTPPRSPLPPLPGRQPSVMRPAQLKQPSTTEANGRFQFRSLAALPTPRPYQPSRRVYASGESRGNAYPLDIKGLCG